jgi:hypothetical protein
MGFDLPCRMAVERLYSIAGMACASSPQMLSQEPSHTCMNFKSMSIDFSFIRTVSRWVGATIPRGTFYGSVPFRPIGQAAILSRVRCPFEQINATHARLAWSSLQTYLLGQTQSCRLVVVWADSLSMRKVNARPRSHGDDQSQGHLSQDFPRADGLNVRIYIKK